MLDSSSSSSSKLSMHCLGFAGDEMDGCGEMEMNWGGGGDVGVSLEGGVVEEYY